MSTGDNQLPGSQEDDSALSRSDLSALSQAELRSELTRSRERYRRLISRKSVRLALRISSYAAPLFGRRNSTATESGGASSPQERIRRTYEHFDESLDLTTRAELHRHYARTTYLKDRSVSVIMPTYNRADSLRPALESVLNQSHRALELIIIDDGSTDDTERVLIDAQADPRVSVIRLDRGGVSRARNEGLRHATGEFIAFLDSDNRWDDQYLELMLAGMDLAGTDIGYSAMRLEQHGHVVGYRGAEFNYEECLQANYVDLNVLCHKRGVSDRVVFFDETLRRLNDWDYLLRIARDREVSYLPFVGAQYAWEETSDQLTLKEPALYRRVVQHRYSGDADGRTELDSATIFRALSLKICIRTAAPYDERERWGDFHFARGLGQALERLGHTVVISFREDPEPELQNVVISLRGLVRYEPVARCVNVLWNISHPDLVDFDEIEQFDLSFAASLTWPTAMSWAVESTCHSLLQATDRAEFFPRTTRTDIDSEVVFVGNSRGVDRWLISAAISQNLGIAIYGAGWEGTPAERSVRSDLLAHHELGTVYAGSAVVLNDHWPSMRDFGFVSNRVFDVGASGGRLISDHIASIPKIFGDAVTTVEDAEDITDALQAACDIDDDRALQTGAWVMENHSFDNRAIAMLSHIERFLFSSEVYARGRHLIGSRCQLCIPSTADKVDDGWREDTATDSSAVVLTDPGRLLSVGILVPSDDTTLADSVYARLIQPLTSEMNGASITLVPVACGSPPSREIEALIVPGMVVSEGDCAVSTVEQVAASGSVIVLDLGDSHDLISLAAATRGTAEASRLHALSTMSSEIWVYSEADARELPLDDTVEIVTLPSALDKRLWMTYRPDRTLDARHSERVALLYTAHTRSDADSIGDPAVILEAIPEADAELIVVGPGSKFPERPWIRLVDAPDSMAYPQYARWLRSIASEAGIGIVVAADDAIRSRLWEARMDEYLALGLVPMAIDERGLLLSDCRGTSPSLQSSRDPRSALHSFTTDADFRSRVREEVETARSEMWAARGAAILGHSEVSRLIDLIDTLRSP